MPRHNDIPSRIGVAKVFWLTLGIALGAPLSLAAGYDSAGTVTAIDEARRTFVVDGREYILSTSARARFDSDTGEQLMTVGDLRTGEYVQLETQGNRVIKVQRYRGGPPS